MLPSNQGDIKNVALEPGRHQICNPLDSFDLRCERVTRNGYNMAMRDLSDMYAQGPREYMSGKSRMAMLQAIMQHPCT